MKTLNSSRILVFFLIFVVELYAHAALPPSFRPGRVRFNAESEYFSSNDNYYDDGSEEPISGDSYTIMSNKIDGTFYFDGQWALTGGVGFAYAKSSSITEDRTNTAFTDAHFRGQKLMVFEYLRLVPELEATLAFSEIDRFADDVLTNEGVHTAKIGSWAAVPFGPVRLYGYGGYEWRAEGRSALGHYLGGLDWRQGAWGANGEIFGYASIGKDKLQDATQVDRYVHLSYVNAGSYRFYSVDPALMSVKAEGFYNFTAQTSLRLGVAKTVAGENSASGLSILAGFSFYMDPPALTSQENRRNYEKRERAKPKSGSGTRNQFIPETEEGYDENLFKESDPNIKEELEDL